MADETTTYDEYAIRWAQRIHSGENISHEYLEKPAMYAQLPDLTGKHVLCVGCGTGEECRALKDKGAASVLGIDISKGLIDFAAQSYPDVEFRVMAMEDIDLPAGSVDFAYSSLTLHYAQSWIDILKRIRSTLVPGGEFLFSTHHPIKWGAEKSRDGERVSYTMGFTQWGNDGAEVHGDYLTERKIEDTLFNKLSVTYWHRPMESLLRDIRESGFEMLDMLEPKAIDTAKAKKKNFWTVHQKIPQFLIFRLRRNG